MPGTHHDCGPAITEIIARVSTMETEAKRQDATLPATVRRFVLDHPAVAFVLVESSKASSLIRNAALLRDAQTMDWSAFSASAAY